MSLMLKDERLLEEIKAEFSQQYPYLKLEFFKHAHDAGEGSPKMDMIVENVSLGSIRTKHSEGTLNISPSLSVGALEDHFESTFGIHVQVFRKSGKLWLETSATDEWTLEEQNKTGAEMS